MLKLKEPLDKVFFLNIERVAMLIKNGWKLFMTAFFLLLMGCGTVSTVSADDGGSSQTYGVIDQETLDSIQKAADEAVKGADQVAQDINKQTDKATGQKSKGSDGTFTSADANNIDKLNKSLFSWRPYTEKIGVSDVGNNVAFGMAQFFWSLNKMVYQINDELLSALSDDGSLTNAFKKAQDNVSGVVKSIFDKGKLLFGSLALIILAIMAFVHFANGRVQNAIRLPLNFIGILAVATIWYGNGNELFNQVNEISSAGQAEMLKVIGDQNQSGQAGDALRVGYFERSIERPYYLMNYGKASAGEVQKDLKVDPYEFISTNSGRDEDKLNETIKSRANSKVDKLRKNNAPDKAGMSFFAIIVSIFNAIPYDAVALFNVFVLVIELALYLLSPFVLVLALFPPFASNGYRIVGTTILWALAKVGSAFLIVLVGSLQLFTDSLIPVSGFGSYAFNALLFFGLVFAVYKFRSNLFRFMGVNYARIEDKIPTKMRPSQLKETAKDIKNSRVGQKIGELPALQRRSMKQDVKQGLRNQKREERRKEIFESLSQDMLKKEKAKTDNLAKKKNIASTIDDLKSAKASNGDQNKTGDKNDEGLKTGLKQSNYHDLKSDKKIDPDKAKDKPVGHVDLKNQENKKLDREIDKKSGDKAYQSLPNKKINSDDKELDHEDREIKNNKTGGYQDIKHSGVNDKVSGAKKTGSDDKTSDTLKTADNSKTDNKTQFATKPVDKEISNSKDKPLSNRDRLVAELLNERKKQAEIKKNQKGKLLNNKFEQKG